MDENFTVSCPHCKEFVLIEKLNCRIFRHGILKSNGLQIDAHAHKELCDYYFEKELIYGCGKPFQIIEQINNSTNKVEFTPIICEYI